MLKQVTLLCALLLSLAASAQNVNWPSPEVEQMYNKAREYHTQGNLQQAVLLYQQAIQLAPDILILYRELGKAYYLQGEYEAAIKTLDPVVKSGEADEQCYQALAASLSANKEEKKAKTVLQKGIERYPHAGILYHETGRIYDGANQPEEALKAWLQGIEASPEYHINYYEAARMYMVTNKPVWAALYAEMFVNMEQQTARANETRKMLLAAYGKIYLSAVKGELPKYGKNKKTEVKDNFEEAVYKTYSKLSPVLTDGMTTESLTMVRTRFMMEWQMQFAHKYPFTLFMRQDEMIRNGYFDIYNQWLFGKAENPQQYEAWNKFHADAMPDMEDWLKNHKFRPVAADFYNDKQTSGIFVKADRN